MFLQIKEEKSTLLIKETSHFLAASHYLVKSLSNKKSLAKVYYFGFE